MLWPDNCCYLNSLIQFGQYHKVYIAVGVDAISVILITHPNFVIVSKIIVNQ